MIHLWVVNDLADNKEPAILKNLARGICEIDRALDPVAKAKLFRQAHRGVAHGDDSARATHLIDDVAPVCDSTCSWTAAITSGVRKLTFSRAVVPLEI